MGLFGALGDALGGFLGHKAQKKQTKKIIYDYNGAETNALAGYTGARDATMAAATGARDASLGYYQPYLAGGQSQFEAAQNMLNPGYQYSPSDPSYKFRYDQGLDAALRGGAAGGSLGSGGMLKALTRYGQGMASTEFAADFNRRNELARYGLQAANGMAGAQSGYADDVGNAQNNYANGLYRTEFGAADGRAGARTQRGEAIAKQFGDVFGAGGDVDPQLIAAMFGF